MIIDYPVLTLRILLISDTGALTPTGLAWRKLSAVMDPQTLPGSCLPDACSQRRTEMGGKLWDAQLCLSGLAESLSIARG